MGASRIRRDLSQRRRRRPVTCSPSQEPPRREDAPSRHSEESRKEASCPDPETESRKSLKLLTGKKEDPTTQVGPRGTGDGGGRSPVSHLETSVCRGRLPSPSGMFPLSPWNTHSERDTIRAHRQGCCRPAASLGCGAPVWEPCTEQSGKTPSTAGDTGMRPPVSVPRQRLSLCMCLPPFPLLSQHPHEHC